MALPRKLNVAVERARNAGIHAWVDNVVGGRIPQRQRAAGVDRQAQLDAPVPRPPLSAPPLMVIVPPESSVLFRTRLPVAVSTNSRPARECWTA